jgi:hypothetical protein
VLVKLASGGTLPGCLTITAGNGSDSVSIQGGGGATDRILGNVLVQLGNGTDSVTVGTDSLAPGTTALGLSIYGSFTAVGGNGNDRIQIGNAAAAASPVKIAGNTTVSAFNTATLGGALVVDQRLGTSPFAPLKTSTLALTVKPFEKVLGAVKVTAGPLAANVQLCDSAGGATGSIGSASITLGAGNDTVKLATVVPSGNVTVSTGAGTDSVSITADTALQGLAAGTGNMTLTLGSGVKAFDLDNAFLAAGNVTINAASGGQNVTFGGQVGGTLTYNANAGFNTFNLDLAKNPTVANPVNGFAFNSPNGGFNALSVTFAANQFLPGVAITITGGSNSLTVNGDGTDTISGFASSSATGNTYTNNVGVNDAGLNLTNWT